MSYPAKIHPFAPIGPGLSGRSERAIQMRKALTAVVSLVALTVAAEATEPGDFDVGSGQHHVDIHAGALPIEHDENAACERVFHSGSVANEPADCEMNENKSKRNAERLWPKVPDDRRKECLGSLDDEIDMGFWIDFYLCLDR